MFNDIESSLTQNIITWEGGTTYSTQRQHIPGYSGFVPGIKCENHHAKTFSKITADALKERSQKLDDNFDPYKTQYEVFHGNTLKEQQVEIQQQVVAKTDTIQNPKQFSVLKRIPKSGYTGHVPIFRNPLRKH